MIVLELNIFQKKLKYFDSFGDEHISKEVEKFIGGKNMITKIYWRQTYNSIMCRYFCIGYIGFMVKGKRLQDYANLFSPNGYKKNDQMILKYFQ